MIQIIVTAHGRLAEELVKTTELIVGAQKELMPICLEMHEGIEDLSRKLTAVIKPVESDEDGCLILVDMFGGTPSNVSLALSEAYALQIVTGVNLPMLLEAVTHRSLLKLPALTEFVREKGKKAIVHANEFLKKQ
ncbi:PTS sugar transporter subunit IIA [candidate division FCPU426 bacterium]|nr:PTS sugar transporter subunit IIA [candidate division FCPU426 bacterium]